MSKTKNRGPKLILSSGKTSTMKYYHRYGEDGACEVICTRCFLTLGIAHGLVAIKDIEARHICSTVAPKKTVTLHQRDDPAESRQTMSRRADRPAELAERIKAFNVLAVCLAVAFFLYVLPTAIEIAVSQLFNPWFAVILPGDIVGCLFLVSAFKMRRTAVILYLLLTVCESCLYEFRIVAASLLPWFTDLAPTLLAGGLILRTRLPGATRFRAVS